MGARTRSAVSVLLGKVALIGAVWASPLPSTTHHDVSRFSGNTEPVVLAKEFRIAATTPSPVPLPTSLALIGSSLLVLALVGATL